MNNSERQIKVSEEHLRRHVTPEQRFQMYLTSVVYLTAYNGLSSINEDIHRDVKICMETVIVQAHEEYQSRGYK